MTIIFTALVLIAIITAIGLLALGHQSRRSVELQAIATELKLNYHSFESLNKTIRMAYFLLFDEGQLREVRHLVEGRLEDDCQISLFDYSLITNTGLTSQTVLLLSCQLNLTGRVCISRKAWLKSDSFSESRQRPLSALQPNQQPEELEHWSLLSDHPAELWQLLTPAVCAWLLRHPHLHIEWSQGILLICRPNFILAGDAAHAAISHAHQLIELLSRQPPLSEVPLH